MRSIIRELVLATGVFFPMVVFCFALSSQFLKRPSKKPSEPVEIKEEFGNATAFAHVPKGDTVSFLFFEQLTR
jgi:hypothetical protein